MISKSECALIHQKLVRASAEEVCFGPKPKRRLFTFYVDESIAERAGKLDCFKYEWKAGAPSVGSPPSEEQIKPDWSKCELWDVSNLFPAQLPQRAKTCLPN